MKNCLLLFFLTAMINSPLFSQPRHDAFLDELLKTNQHPVFRQVIEDPSTYRLQVIYTRIDRNKNNKPSFHHHYFNYDPALYWNPASTVKLPLAALALEKLNSLKSKGVDKYTTIQFDSSYPGQRILHVDETAPGGKPTIAHLIKRALLISENDPYNRLYQFVGQQEIHRSLRAKGYQGLVIPRQFMGFTPDQNRRSNPLRFIDSKGQLLYSQPELYNPEEFDFSRSILLGHSHMNNKNELVNEPFDFSVHNNLTLEHLQQILQSIVFPASVKKKQRFGITEDDRRFLLQYLSQYPSETPYPLYDEKKFYDSYVKFFFHDSTGPMPSDVRVFNKVGWAYGFMTDVSYVADFENNIEYMLTATLYVNSDGVLNDGKYEYEQIGYPFMYQLGQAIYQHELTRKRKHRPNLDDLKLEYEKRDPGDTRTPVTEVDN